jgi:hypothetical protein
LALLSQRVSALYESQETRTSERFFQIGSSPVGSAIWTVRSKSRIPRKIESASSWVTLVTREEPPTPEASAVKGASAAPQPKPQKDAPEHTAHNALVRRSPLGRRRKLAQPFYQVHGGFESRLPAEALAKVGQINVTNLRGCCLQRAQSTVHPEHLTGNPSAIVRQE